MLKERSPRQLSTSEWPNCFILPVQSDYVGFLFVRVIFLNNLKPKTVTVRAYTLSIEDKASASAALYCHLKNGAT